MHKSVPDDIILDHWMKWNGTWHEISMRPSRGRRPASPVAADGHGARRENGHN